MDPKAENVIQNIGAIAESVSVFYNSIARQVPKDVALVLTRHFMDLTIGKRGLSPEARIAIQTIATQAQRRAAEERKKQAEQKAQEASDSGESKPPQPREEPAPPAQQDEAAK